MSAHKVNKIKNLGVWCDFSRWEFKCIGAQEWTLARDIGENK